ncbi:MAG: LacI family DNA-binding transcriptional regulator [Treponema sp.]|jgi:LacI family sucrose operon transcriptional repressor|nr:LacI family DNA-binding transcriptional regulator [Treponema sp.]
MSTIKDVAKKAGVGVGTVSRVINYSGAVSSTTRQRVEQIIEEMNFVPSQLARNFNRSKNFLVGLIVPDIAHPFFGEFIRHAENELYQRGYKALVCNTIQQSDREQVFLDMLRYREVDGIITGSHSLDIEAYLAVKAPLAALDRRLGAEIPVVHADHVKGGRLAAERLLRSGCKHIAQFTGDSLVTLPAYDRHTAFAEALNGTGVSLTSIPNQWNRFDFSYHLEQVKQTLDEYREIDGIFGVDLIACAALKAASQRGIAVPDQLKIVGYDGTCISAFTPKTITTVVQPIADLAAAAVSAVIDRIEKRPIGQNEITLDVYLREGETT